MKRCLFISVIIFTLVLSFTACTKETEYTVGDFDSTVSFALSEMQIKGNLVFRKDNGITFTVIQPEKVKDSDFISIYGETYLEFDGVQSAVPDTSPLKKLFAVLYHFSAEPHMITAEGTKSFEGTADDISYEIVFDCTEGKIKEIIIDSVVYVFG